MMMEHHVRNQAIAEAHEAGESVTALALRFELKPPTIKRIIEDMKPYTRVRFGRELPAGISLVSAVTIQQAIGLWPASDNLEEIQERRIDLLRAAHGRRVRVALSEVAAAMTQAA
jgi:transposase-like protein